MMKKVSFTLTEDQYNDFKELLYETSENVFLNGNIAELILKLVEENSEEYWLGEAIEEQGAFNEFY